MTDLHDTDILERSGHRAALLRRAAGGERINNTDLNWPNLIDEVKGVGRSQLSAIRSLPIRALAHDLKAKAWPLCQEVGGVIAMPLPWPWSKPPRASAICVAKLTALRSYAMSRPRCGR